MRIERRNIRDSPFVGIFGAVTDAIGLFPLDLAKKDLKALSDIFGVECIKTSIAGSSLIGVLCRGNKQGFLLPWIAEEREESALQEQGVKTKKIDLTAIGNLFAFNDSKGIASETISLKMLKEIEKFLAVKFARNNLAGMEIPGSNLVVSNKGFVINPNVSDKEFKFIKKTFGLKGLATTANYGDQFIANNVLANSNGVIAGMITSGPEMERIDEALVH